MKTNQRWHQAWSAAAAVVALLVIAGGVARAAPPSTTAYHFSSHPMISGSVVSVNDHQMVVDTDQGERVTLEVDSRTMAPRDLMPGMVMRVEFLALEDCRFYAQRVMPIRGGMSTRRLQAYANPAQGGEAMTYHAAAHPGRHGENIESPASAGSRTSPPMVDEHSVGSMMTASPATADYRSSTRPMISGRVVSVNDHRLVVETDQGQTVGLVMDSRTMVPTEVAPGTVVCAEFTPMQDGRYYAGRVSRRAGGDADREQAYAHTRDSETVIAGNAADCGFVSAGTGNSVMSVVARRGTRSVPEPVVAESAPVPVAESPETLPQTASNQPLILLLGLSALGCAGLITVMRGLRVV